MKLGDLVAVAQDLISARRVYGEPVERDGVVVIPAATVFGGGGGGADEESGMLPVREGAGFGLVARPTGAFVIRDGEVSWVPAVDVTLLRLATTAVAFTVAVSLSRIVRAHRRLS